MGNEFEDQPDLNLKPKSKLDRLQAKDKEVTKNLQNWFKSTRFGSRYTRVIGKIDRLKIGNFEYGELLRHLVSIVLVLVAYAGILQVFRSWDETQFAYQLSEAQKEQGFNFTCTGKSCNLDDVAVRYFTTDEEMLAPECESGSVCWDVKAIPVAESCSMIVFEVNYYENDWFTLGKFGTVTQEFRPESGGLYLLGHEYDLRLSTTEPNSNYIRTERVYCSWR